MHVERESHRSTAHWNKGRPLQANSANKEWPSRIRLRNPAMLSHSASFRNRVRHIPRLSAVRLCVLPFDVVGTDALLKKARSLPGEFPNAFLACLPTTRSKATFHLSVVTEGNPWPLQHIPVAQAPHDGRRAQ